MASTSSSVEHGKRRRTNGSPEPFPDEDSRMTIGPVLHRVAVVSCFHQITIAEIVRVKVKLAIVVLGKNQQPSSYDPTQPAV